MSTTQSGSRYYSNAFEKFDNIANPIMHSLSQQVIRNLVKNALNNSKTLLPIISAHTVQSNRVQYSSTYKQQKLLRFPALPLDETLPKFLRSVEPLLTEDEYEKTKCEVEQFRTEDGVKLQKLLEKAAQAEENWLANRWLRAAYLQYRDPVPVYINPGMTFPMQKFENDDEWLDYTAKVIYGLIKYKEVIDNGELPVLKMGKLELDNSQFHKVYGTCRVPKPKEDGIEYYPNSKHIVVLYKNNFFKLWAYDRDGKPLSPCLFKEQLHDIVCSNNQKGPPIGILSADNRDNWACAYAELTKSIENEKALKLIQSSLFTVSLDEPVPSKDDKEWNVLSKQLIYGGGSEENTANRWMDKTIQLISNPNGMSGFCYEHSPAEGQPIAVIVDYVVKNLKNPKFYESASKSTDEKVIPIKIRTTPCMQKYFDEATNNIDKLGGNLQVNVMHFKEYGKGFLKEQKVSPDSFIQIALQYAFYRLHKVPGAQYESAHLRIYYGGRTETIRSCSNESIAFAKAMLDKSADNECRLQLLLEAVKGHRQYTTMALQGRGVDRHMLGLKLMAIENNLPIPKLYSTPGWLRGVNFRVSTSQVATPNPAFMVYGPAVDDGYGCCYNPRECDIILAITAWKSNNVTCTDRFAATIEIALCEMQQLMLSGGCKKNSKL